MAHDPIIRIDHILALLPGAPQAMAVDNMKRRHAILILLVSVVLFGARTLDIYWDEYGRTDADHMRGAALAARHGTLRYIQEVGDITDSTTWALSNLYRHDQEAFRAMIRPPGYLVVYDYPPVFAAITFPLSYLDAPSFAALWWWISIVLYLLCIWKVIDDLRVKFVFSALALHFPPFLAHLEFGSTIIVVMGLALCGGSLGLALAGWLKFYPWSLVLTRGVRLRRVALWVVLLGLVGLVATHMDVKPFYTWWHNLAQHQRAAGHAGILTWIRVGIAGVALLWALYKKWHPAIVFAIAQAVSPVWWPGYWCVFVPVIGLGINYLYEQLGRFSTRNPSFSLIPRRIRFRNTD